MFIGNDKKVNTKTQNSQSKNVQPAKHFQTKSVLQAEHFKEICA